MQQVHDGTAAVEESVTEAMNRPTIIVHLAHDLAPDRTACSGVPMPDYSNIPRASRLELCQACGNRTRSTANRVDHEALRVRTCVTLSRVLAALDALAATALGTDEKDGHSYRDELRTEVCNLRAEFAGDTARTEVVIRGYMVSEHFGPDGRHHLGISTSPDERTAPGDRVIVLRDG